jgi:Homing endonuclease associated repeat
MFNISKMSGYDKNFLIEEFFRYKYEFGSYPQLKELNKASGYPSATPFKRFWNSYNDLLVELKLIRTDNTDGWFIEEENMLKECYTDLNYTPDQIISKLLRKRSWDTVKRKANKLGLSRKGGVPQQFTNEFLLSELKRYYDENGEIPRYGDFEKNPNFPSATVVKKRFGWNNALKLAGFKPNTFFGYTKNDLISMVQQFHRTNNRSPFHYEIDASIEVVSRHFGGFHNLLNEAGLIPGIRTRVPFNKEKGIELLRKVHKELGKTPNMTDFSKFGVNRAWIRKVFGSKQNALIESGICTEKDFYTREDRIINSYNLIKSLSQDLNRPPTASEYDNSYNLKKPTVMSRRLLSTVLNKRFTEICIEVLNLTENYAKHRYGSYSIDRNGEFCRSYKEKIISNLLIDNDLHVEKEKLYREVDNGFISGHKMDWFIPYNYVCVELFGMYDENANEDDPILFEYKKKTEAKINICELRSLTLVSIFYSDSCDDILKKFKDAGIELTPTAEFLAM